MQEYPISSYKEDVAFIKVIQNQDSIVKGLIEISSNLTINLSLSLSKLTETLLYSFYQLHEEDSARSLLCMLTNLEVWHIFVVNVNRQSKLVINSHFCQHFDASNITDILIFIARVFLMITSLPD